MPNATPENIDKIVVLYREPETLSLWGIPYDMRPGQEPRHIRRQSRGEWMWLGCPGWRGSMSREEQTAVASFLEKHKGNVPGNAHEWSRLERKETDSR